MKRVITVCMALLLALCFASCGKVATPTEATEQYLGYIKEQVDKNISDMKDGESVMIFDTFDVSSDDYKDLDADTVTNMEEVLQKIGDFDYEIVNEEISSDDENVAYVTVKFTAYDCGEIMESIKSKVVSMSVASAMADKTEQQIVNEKYEYIFSNLNKAEKTYTKEIKIKVEKIEGSWTVEDKELQVADAVTGGLITAAKSLNMME